ncbi:3-hydroxyacyl-CoA dehydrogenase [Zafaria cholistanensis]|uniref:3-hydroxyacyl-CoA dehydrogenase n=1 Tax=Zafaria cholistanensis TaxID=1682741 RepID=A0A5A7NPH9_9MICC|nr:SDR family NAD(P)-dependent oxidoreductase [Zafaria cholistanensis]GER22814.1 3-hydroxyacyl-CoA dehydrogenase [Zafaria cholistanensis]
MLIDGASAIVTGAASGLGAATARRLHDAGAHVVLVDLPSAAGAKAAYALGPRARFVPADVTDEDQIRAAVVLASSLGPLRVAVNCAGIATPGKVLGRNGPLPLEDFDRVVRINLTGTFNVLRLAAEAMAATDPWTDPATGTAERGVVVNTASVAAFEGQIGQPAYAASKGAVASLTLPAARELAHHLIRVVAIAPGLFKTPMLAGLPAEVTGALAATVPHPSRLGRPEEFAALVAHIVENQMLNGETIRLDGAIRMAPR